MASRINLTYFTDDEGSLCSPVYSNVDEASLAPRYIHDKPSLAEDCISANKTDVDDTFHPKTSLHQLSDLGANDAFNFDNSLFDPFCKQFDDKLANFFAVKYPHGLERLELFEPHQEGQYNSGPSDSGLDTSPMVKLEESSFVSLAGAENVEMDAGTTSDAFEGNNNKYQDPIDGDDHDCDYIPQRTSSSKTRSGSVKMGSSEDRRPATRAKLERKSSNTRKALRKRSDVTPSDMTSTKQMTVPRDSVLRQPSTVAVAIYSILRLSGEPMPLAAIYDMVRDLRARWVKSCEKAHKDWKVRAWGSFSSMAFG